MKFETINGIWLNHRFIVSYYFCDNMVCCKDVNGHFYNIVNCDSFNKLEPIIRFIETESITELNLSNNEIRYYVERL